MPPMPPGSHSHSVHLSSYPPSSVAILALADLGQKGLMTQGVSIATGVVMASAVGNSVGSALTYILILKAQSLPNLLQALGRPKMHLLQIGSTYPCVRASDRL